MPGCINRWTAVAILFLPGTTSTTGTGQAVRCDEGKFRHASERDANDLISIIANKRLAKGKPPQFLRSYGCPFCGFWHLTSSPKRDVWAWQMSNNGENKALYESYLRRRRETPMFDKLARERKLRGRAFR